MDPPEADDGQQGQQQKGNRPVPKWNVPVGIEHRQIFRPEQLFQIKPCKYTETLAIRTGNGSRLP